MSRIKPTAFSNIFAVELWSDDESKPLETLATAGNFYIARAAFTEALRRHPDKPVLVRHGIRVVLHSRNEGRTGADPGPPETASTDDSLADWGNIP